MRATRRLLGALVLALGAGCSDSTGNDQEQTTVDELQFLRLDAAAPPLAATTASFWARKGTDRELRLYHRARLGEEDSTEFLRFRVDDESLDRRPDGSVIAFGDSVLITVTVIDLANLVVAFEPSGLRFDPDEPAELKFKFNETDDDLDEDGDVDDDDLSRETELAIWRQEFAGAPWVRLSSRIEIELDEIEADILGFTNYAIAYRR
jgi:hypothetical protein